MMRDLLRLLRVHQYAKNFFILCPLFFAGQINDLPLVGVSLMAMVFFCLTASSVYILNDVRDAEFDRQHPRKQNRPIASGRVKPPAALALGAVLLIAGLLGMYLLNRQAGLILIGYIALNVGYSLWLKHIPILDISIIATGFVLRLFVGAAVTGVALSAWIVIMTFLLAYFLGLAKRRDDVDIYEKTGKMMRKSIDGYNMRFLDTALAIMAAIVIVAYMMYTVSPEVISRMGTERLYLTSLFVIVGVLRHLQLTFVEEKGSSPTRVLLYDRFTQANLICWLAAFWLLIY